MNFLIPALLLGTLGSLHCVGMCGPIALAVPVKKRTWINMLGSSFFYNLGRAFTYSTMGAVSGSLGLAVKWAGGQQLLSILCGSFILFFLLVAWTGKKWRLNVVERAMQKLKQLFSKLFRNHNSGSVFLLGTLNGFLPCGLVYAGLAGAAATGSSLNGALFMFAFGLGTFPAMTALMLAGMRFSVRWREKLRKAVPVMVALMALVLILRGMELGVPLLSPKAEKGKVTCPYCLREKN